MGGVKHDLSYSIKLLNYANSSKQEQNCSKLEHLYWEWYVFGTVCMWSVWLKSSVRWEACYYFITELVSRYINIYIPPFYISFFLTGRGQIITDNSMNTLYLQSCCYQYSQAVVDNLGRHTAVTQNVCSHINSWHNSWERNPNCILWSKGLDSGGLCWT